MGTVLGLFTLGQSLSASPAGLAESPRREILFCSDRGEVVPNCEIYAMRTDGSDIAQLTDDVNSFSNAPDWSPNGKRISFFRCDLFFFNCDIWVMDADGSDQVQLTNTPGLFEQDPRWSPDGKQILFSNGSFANNDLFTMDADGSNVTKITNTPTLSEFSADWSPNGEEIIYSYLSPPFDIVRHHLKSNTKTNLTSGAGSVDGTPRWSRNGRQIAFSSNRDSGSAVRDIYVMNADGSNVIRLTDSGYDDWSPHWSRDGRRIYFASARDGLMAPTHCLTPNVGFCTQMYVMDADGLNEEQVLVEDASIHRFAVY